MTKKQDPAISRKRGALATSEEQYILANKDSLSIAEIAKNLNRKEAPIQKFLSEKAKVVHLGISLKETTDVEYRAKLHQKYYWKTITQQFSKSDGELQSFESAWIAIMKQFKDDVLAIEEHDIVQWITLNILMNRSMISRKRAMDEAENIQKEIDREYRLGPEERDRSLIAGLEGQRNMIVSSIQNYTKEHAQLLNEAKYLKQALKAARADRIKLVEDGKTSFVGLLRQLEDAEHREREGLEAEVMSRAAVKARKEMGKAHKYVDDQFDLPILSADSILAYDEEQEDYERVSEGTSSDKPPSAEEEDEGQGMDLNFEGMEG